MSPLAAVGVDVTNNVEVDVEGLLYVVDVAG
jgi:hypothetical protein